MIQLTSVHGDTKTVNHFMAVPGANIIMNHLTTLPGARRTMSQLTAVPGYSRTMSQLAAVPGYSRTMSQLAAVPGYSRTMSQLAAVPGYSKNMHQITAAPGTNTTMNQLTAVPDDSGTIKHPLTVPGARNAMNHITIFMLAAFLLLASSGIDPGLSRPEVDPSNNLYTLRAEDRYNEEGEGTFPMRGQACPEPLTCLPREECVSRLRGHTQAQTDILFACSSTHGENTICCPAVESLEEWDASSTVAVPLRSSVHPSLHLMPSGEACDVPSRDRIRNGIVAEQGQFPWMTLLGYRCNKPVFTTTARELVRLGELDTNTEQDCVEPYPGEKICADPVLDIKIERVVKHKSFNTPFLKNDIALLRLVSEVPSYTEFIRPICLPFGLDLNRNEDKKYQVAGWGKTEHYNLGRDSANLPVISSGRYLGATSSRHSARITRRGTSRRQGKYIRIRVEGEWKTIWESHTKCSRWGSNPDLPVFGSLVQHEISALDHVATEADNTVGSSKLMFTFLQNVPLEDCDSSQAPEVRPLDQTQLCAGGNLGKDACRGDSGGPLMDKRESPTTSQVQTYQLGIVSFGSIPCGSNKAPSVFTRVSEYLDWILDNIHP
uniref:Peptidase S1 domain-containing protein n=1 Tax=Timema genevievae TaxID=629358 RepID=A0A7R9PIQ6_TIMGE|nr:unnamed protein product [Timema genevievae]